MRSIDRQQEYYMHNDECAYKDQQKIDWQQRKYDKYLAREITIKEDQMRLQFSQFQEVKTQPPCVPSQ